MAVVRQNQTSKKNQMNTKLKLLGLASILGLGTAAQGQVGIDVDLVAWDTVNGSSVTATDLNSLISGSR